MHLFLDVFKVVLLKNNSLTDLTEMYYNIFQTEDKAIVSPVFLKREQIVFPGTCASEKHIDPRNSCAKPGFSQGVLDTPCESADFVDTL